MNFITGKFSKEEDNFIINNFENMTVPQIASILNRKYHSVEDRTRKLKLIKANKTKWTKEEEEKLIYYYNKTPDVFNMFPGRTRESISYKAFALGLKKQNRGEFSCDFDYFKKWTHNMAYILGFIAADGCITGNSNGRTCNSLNITQSNNDRYILEFMQNEFKSKRKIQYIQKTNICHLVLTNSEIIKDLNNLGIYERKSLAIEWINNIPKEFLHDFIRGYIDGDGCICTYNRKNRGLILEVTVLGTRNFLEGMSKTISEYIGIKQIKVFDVKNNHVKRMKYSQNTAVKLLSWLYQDEDAICLKRKKEKYINFLQQDNNSNQNG